MQLESFLGYTSIEIITNDDKSASMIENLSPKNKIKLLIKPKSYLSYYLRDL